MRHAYTGERCPALLPVPVYEGWLDAKRLHRREPLYRWPWRKALMYRCGWYAARLLGRRPAWKPTRTVRR